MTDRGKIKHFFAKMQIPKEWKDPDTTMIGGGLRKRKVEPEGSMGPCMDMRRIKTRRSAEPETRKPEETTNFGGFRRNLGGKIPNLEGGDYRTDDYNCGFGIIGRSKEEIKRDESLGEFDKMTKTNKYSMMR